VAALRVHQPDQSHSTNEINSMVQDKDQGNSGNEENDVKTWWSGPTERTTGIRNHQRSDSLHLSPPLRRFANGLYHPLPKREKPLIDQDKRSFSTIYDFCRHIFYALSSALPLCSASNGVSRFFDRQCFSSLRIRIKGLPKVIPKSSF
jgi:hypothetical protein